MSDKPDGNRVLWLLVQKLAREALNAPREASRNLRTIEAVARDSASGKGYEKAKEIVDFYDQHVGENRVIVSYPAPQPDRDPDHLNPAKGGNRASDDYW